MKLRKFVSKGKFNSKVAFEKKQGKTTPKPNKEKHTKVSRKCTAENVTLSEVALNNKVLRLYLLRENLKAKSSRSIQANSKSVPSNKRSALSSQKTYNKVVFKTKTKPLKVNLFNSNRTQKKKMVVNNGKVSKHDPDDYLVKRLKSKQNAKVFYLKPCPYKTVSEGKLNYKFHQLVNDVKNMQLPTATWKIKVIIRHNKIAAIIFTNKAELERSLSFNSDDDKYHLVIDNKPALLLGSPGKVNSCSEIEVLLSIMETIEKDSPMLMFK